MPKRIYYDDKYFYYHNTDSIYQVWFSAIITILLYLAFLIGFIYLLIWIFKNGGYNAMFAAVIGFFVGIYLFYRFAKCIFNGIKYSTKRVVFIVDEDDIHCALFYHFQNSKHYTIPLADISGLEANENNELIGLVLKNSNQKYIYWSPRECLKYLHEVRNMSIVL